MVYGLYPFSISNHGVVDGVIGVIVALFGVGMVWLGLKGAGGSTGYVDHGEFFIPSTQEETNK